MSWASPVPKSPPPVSLRCSAFSTDRDDLVFRYRVRSLDWRLDRPSLRLPNAFAHLSPGDTIDLRLRRDGRTYCLSLNAAQRCGAGYTAGIGWAFLYYPSSFTSWMRITMNALWVGGLLLIVGWAAVDWPTRLLGAAGGAAVLALLPPVVGLAPTTGAEWLGAIVGILLGSLAHPLPGAQRTE